jgi:uncharacterized protein
MPTLNPLPHRRTFLALLSRVAIMVFAVALTGSHVLAQDTRAQDAGKPQTGLPTLKLMAGGKPIKAEVASTDPTRQIGLMHRTSMGANDGMLFVFPQLGYHSMWMRNTLIPLSVAYLDDSGKILSIHEMQPLDETPHMAAGPARYALEMNAKWFANNKVAVGDAIKGIDKAPKPQ